MAGVTLDRLWLHRADSALAAFATGQIRTAVDSAAPRLAAIIRDAVARSLDRVTVGGEVIEVDFGAHRVAGKS